MSNRGRSRAWSEKKGQRFLLVFRLNGARYKKLLDLMDRREADAITAKVERRIEMRERGEWQLPDPSQVTDSLLGELAPRPVVQLSRGRTLGAMIDEYIPSVPNGRLESNTVATLTIHLNHVRQVMGRTLRVESITFAALQKYVDIGSKARGRRGLMKVRINSPASSTVFSDSEGSYSTVLSPPADFETRVSIKTSSSMRNCAPGCRRMVIVDLDLKLDLRLIPSSTVEADPDSAVDVVAGKADSTAGG